MRVYQSISKRSAKGLTDDQQHQLCTLLLEFQDIFSRGPHDLCRTGVTKHKINTCDAPPVPQHPRRLPCAQREEAFKAVKEMHAQGMIEPSASPWASLVVLVKKKGWRYQILIRLPEIKRTDQEGLVPFTEGRHNSRRLVWFKLVLHPRPQKWVLAIGGRRAGPREDCLHCR